MKENSSQQASAPSGFFDEVEAARRLGVSRRFMQSRRMQNLAPAWVKIGRLVRYRAEDLERYLADCERGPVDPRSAEER